MFRLSLRRDSLAAIARNGRHRKHHCHPQSQSQSQSQTQSRSHSHSLYSSTLVKYPGPPHSQFRCASTTSNVARPKPVRQKATQLKAPQWVRARSAEPDRQGPPTIMSSLGLYPPHFTDDHLSLSPSVHPPTPAPASGKKRDPVQPPSQESGGVPDPSPTYLVNASLPPLQLAYPRKILVVIDLNGTLLYRPNKRTPHYFIERPYARRFLSYCIDTFVVVIWSSAQPKNVSKMCEQLLTEEQREKVVAIWGREKFQLANKDWGRRVMCYKRMNLLWKAEDIARRHPEWALGKTWSQADTVLIDDSPEKGRTEPYNIIPIPEFAGDMNSESSYILPQVHDYLNECARQVDISTYIRASPFKPKPISMLHRQPSFA